ncbi:MAG: glutamate 5-kinase [Anaerolineae bacterium]|nr:glutamate 5-kinase [Anaerolineae bacterium]
MRIVIKLGTSTLTGGSDKLNRPRMVDLVRQIADLDAQGHELLLVSSGAILAGRETLGVFPQRRDIPSKQTLAAVGQVRLMAIYQQLFELYNIKIAQALLTRADLADREHYLNARDTMLLLLNLHIVPVINENDVVAVEEVRIGDNDNLSALVANLVDADLLIILTDQAGLFTADPRDDPSAKLIEEVVEIDDHIRSIAAGSGSSAGTGGMATKVEAAEMATRSGTEVIVSSGKEPNILLRLAGRERVGTRFLPVLSHIESRKRWILAESPRGDIRMDHGAVEALIHRGKSLLAVGVTDVLGCFERGSTVRLLSPDGSEIARGIILYSAQELTAIRGCHSDEIAEILDNAYGPTVVHRDDMVLLTSRK